MVTTRLVKFGDLIVNLDLVKYVYYNKTKKVAVVRFTTSDSDLSGKKLHTAFETQEAFDLALRDLLIDSAGW